MVKIALIKEGKIPADNRVALTPLQCKWIHAQFPQVKIVAQSSPYRCFSDYEYRRAGIEVIEEVTDCDVLIGIKEVPTENLIAGKTYLFFSHTKKKQPHNQKLLQAIIQKKITL
ncbi:MAG: alanine dehydrogenase, partial [Chitinophagaceae bacterium]